MSWGSYTGEPWNNLQPNNPFLDMIAAIDGPGDDVQQQNLPKRRPNNIKLPDFGPTAPAIWFARAELRFEVSGIMSERERFAHAVNTLSQDATCLVTDLITALPADRPYTLRKKRLLIYLFIYLFIFATYLYRTCAMCIVPACSA